MSKSKAESGHLSDDRLVQIEASAVAHDADSDSDEIAAMASELRWRRREWLKDSKLAEEVKRTRWNIEHAITKIENLEDAVRDRGPRSGPRRVSEDAGSSMGIGTASGVPIPPPPGLPAHLVPDMAKMGRVLKAQAEWIRELLAQLGADHPVAAAAVALCNENSDIDDLRRVIDEVGQRSFDERLKLLPERLIMGPIPQPVPRRQELPTPIVMPIPGDGSDG